MRVLIAPDTFAGSLSAGQAAAAMAQGWSEQAPGDVVRALPLSGGGAGFVAAVAAAAGGPHDAGDRGDGEAGDQLVPVTVSGPTGADVPATVLLTSRDGRRTAYLESAQVTGRHLAPGADPARTTTAGVAALLRAAVAAGATRVVVGCGPAATNDGGAGMLAALGAGDDQRLLHGGGALHDLPDDALAGLADVRAGLARVELVAATDDDLPLLGFHGTSATSAPELGATAGQAQLLERALGRFSDVAQRSLVAGRALMGRGQAAEAGSGAAGGLGFALLLLGARRVSGVHAVLDAVGFERHLAGADLLVTGSGSFDGGSLHHGVVAEVSQLALRAGVPVVVVARRVEVGRREALAIGVAATYAVEGARGAVDAHPAGALAARTARVARTWSR